MPYRHIESNIQKRFLKQVIDRGFCWEWDGKIIPWDEETKRGGYGISTYRGLRTTAHRVSFMMFRGPIPDDTLVCHSCDNRLCVHPGHLFLGSRRDNTQDMLQKGRGRWQQK